MNASLNAGMNEIRGLSAVELDVVSGGAVVTKYDFKVAGMHITGGYDEKGKYGVWVQYGKEFIMQGGQL
jgi:hypothetical protein